MHDLGLNPIIRLFRIFGDLVALGREFGLNSGERDLLILRDVPQLEIGGAVHAGIEEHRIAVHQAGANDVGAASGQAAQEQCNEQPRET